MGAAFAGMRGGGGEHLPIGVRLSGGEVGTESARWTLSRKLALRWAGKQASPICRGKTWREAKVGQTNAPYPPTPVSSSSPSRFAS